MDRISSVNQDAVLVRSLRWTTLVMPALRLFALCLLVAFEHDLCSLIVHALVTTLECTVAACFYHRMLAHGTASRVFAASDTLFFLYLALTFDPLLGLLWASASLYVAAFAESPVVSSSPKLKTLTCLRPVALTALFGLLTADAEGACSTKNVLTVFSLASCAAFGLASYAGEVWHHKRTQSELQEAKRQLTVVMEAVPIGLFILTTSRQIVSANEAALRLLGCPHPPDLGEQLDQHCYKQGSRHYAGLSEPSSIAADILHFLTTQSPQDQADFGLTEHSGKAISWQGMKTIWDSKPVLLMTVTDATHLMELERVQLESSCKTVMLRSVSHELRSPTNGIQHAVVSVAEADDIPPWAKERLQVGVVCCKHLLMLIGDLLDYSQLAAGKFRLAKIFITPASIFGDCFELMKFVAEKKQIYFVKHIDPLLPELIHTDPNRLTQVILNLLSNAVKFTPRHGKIALKAVLDSQGLMEISVQDSGIGIAAEQIGNLFKVFGRIETSAGVNPQGVGLGLHISNLLSKELGPSGIEVQSVQNEGSCFKFRVKIFESAAMTVEEISPSPDTSMSDFDGELPIQNVYKFHTHSGDCPEVLVVDDSSFNRLVIVEMLATMHISCAEVDSGPDALKYLELNARQGITVEVIIMDFEMPEMNGPAATRAILELISGFPVKLPRVIGHSANYDDHTRDACREAGMVDFLAKPSSKGVVLSTVRRYL
jgi:signal transduction histidine kinase/PAS domain-containing protein